MEASIKVDTREFNAALREYLQWTTKDLSEVVNTKAFFIALKALQLTPAVKSNQIRSDLLQTIRPSLYGRNKIRRGGQPIRRVYLIVQARQRAKGEKGLYGPAMAEAVEKILAARPSSASFEKSGWVRVLQELAPLVPSARGYASAHDIKLVGAPKGESIVAQPDWEPTAMIINRAEPKHGPKARRGQLHLMMQNALQLAVDHEAASTVAYIEKKLQERADRYNSR